MANVFGAAVQMCTLPWLGFVPDEVAAPPPPPPPPPPAAPRLSERLVIPVAELDAYAQREQTRTDHLREIAAYLGRRSMDELLWKEVDESLFSRAMEHDSPKLLFGWAAST